ncbi:hypothetical protein ACFFU8_09390 [Chromobacterium piscinae]|uniref:hypothetical protein n=1 Tax=Chromobacterium piscinae TaxID=686831 RepID=UPI001E3F1AD8|nr:hypothetical protein [Chromobacterium piscinae]MCD5327882.1 hypothetical protein [Chromobacterium piscinae]
MCSYHELVNLVLILALFSIWNVAHSRIVPGRGAARWIGWSGSIALLLGIMMGYDEIHNRWWNVCFLASFIHKQLDFDPWWVPLSTFGKAAIACLITGLLLMYVARKLERKHHAAK